jgi:hypothetical protein
MDGSAIDVSLLIFAALEGDRDLYSNLERFASAHLVLDVVDDPYTRGFVVWRYREGVPPDASGTTEALRLAEGYWRGSLAFDRPTDRERALTILEGYARHQAEEQGIWMIRNYFNLGTRSFATNSFLVDYAPDFVAEAAVATGNAPLLEIAEKSYDLIERAQSKSGLLYDIIQPEVKTLLDDDRMVVFSPNDAIQVSNAATVAAWSVRGRPGVARQSSTSVTRAHAGAQGTYYGRTGEIARDNAGHRGLAPPRAARGSPRERRGSRSLLSVPRLGTPGGNGVSPTMPGCVVAELSSTSGGGAGPMKRQVLELGISSRSP